MKKGEKKFWSRIIKGRFYQRLVLWLILIIIVFILLLINIINYKDLSHPIVLIMTFIFGVLVFGLICLWWVWKKGIT